MAVSAKFKVSRVTPQGYPEPHAHEIEMTPDYGQGKNEEWAFATPAGVVRLTVVNKKAIEQLPLGQAVTIVFTPSED